MKEEQRLKTIRDTLFALVVVTVCSILLWYSFDCYYDLNDDVMLKDILSGTYTGSPSPMNIQMLYPAGVLISIFYRLVPSLPWYGIFLCTCHFLCIFLIAKRSISFAAGFLKKCIVIVTQFFLLSGLLLYELIYIQYSVTCALLAATGIFLFYTTDDRLEPGKFIRKNIISMILVILAFYVRTEMMLLLCPMIGAAGLAKWFQGSVKTKTGPFKIQNLLKYLTTLIVVLVGMGVGLISNEIAYGSEEWREFDAFFDYRTELYDFQESPPDYEENQVYYNGIGLAAAEVELLNNYNFALDDKIDADILNNIVNYNRVFLGKDYFKYGLYDGLRLYLYQVTHTDDAPWIYVVWMLYLLVLITGIMQKNIGIVWKLALLFSMRSVSWMYLIMRGRMRDRITNSLYLAEVLILAAMLLIEMHRLLEEYRIKTAAATERGDKRMPYIPQYRRYWPLTAALLLIVLTAVPVLQNVRRVEQEQERREQVNREWELICGYFMEHPDHFYLVDVYSTVKYSEKMFVNVDNSYRNFDICGGWTSKSPIYAEKLSRRGIGNIESDLMHMNNVYFVTGIDRDMDWIVAYYRSKGYEIRLDTEKCFKVDGEKRFMVYKVRLYRELEQADAEP